MTVNLSGCSPLLPTSLTLLERLQQNPSAADWERVCLLYEQLISRWVHRALGSRDGVSDIAQEVMVAVIRDIPKFEHRGAGSFRGWLRGITVNRLHEFYRARRRNPIPSPVADETDDFLARLADPVDALTAQWDREHDQWVFAKLCALIEPDFEPTTWRAFRMVTLEDQRAVDVAAETGLTVNAVLLAKSRILKRLREEAGVFLE